MFIKSSFITALTALALAAQAKILAPLNEPEGEGKVIPGRYIVRLKRPHSSENTQVSGQQALRSHGEWLTTLLSGMRAAAGEVRHYYSSGHFHGYAGSFGEEVIDKIRERPEVDYVEKDQMVHVADWKVLKPRTKMERRLYRSLKKDQRKKKPKKDGNVGMADFRLGKRMVQTNAPWGLCRLSNKYLPRIFKRFTYPMTAGKGVDAYIIDTGINVEHMDFDGRAHWGITVPEDDQDIDGNGHGTHVAGTIGGKTYGVAKKTELFAVKVLRTSGFGSNSDVIKGVEWVMDQHKKKMEKEMAPRSVANMSLGGGKSYALEEMINQAVEAGVHFAVAAGNEGDDACGYSPAGAQLPLTVGAINELDEMAFFSNNGKCVDVFAPGVDITSAWIGTPYALNTISGTSMATPHVVGILALHLGGMNYTPKELKERIIKMASKDIITGLPDDTPNVLVNIEQLSA